MADNFKMVSSLDEINFVLQEMGIVEVGQANQVQFCVHHKASLKEAAKMKVKTRPGRLGFGLVNPELLDCKLKAKIELDECFNTFLNTCMVRCDQELATLQEHIDELKVLMLNTDDQITHVRPVVDQRNRGVQHMLYPSPPFPEDPDYELDQELVPYQLADETDAQRITAVACDKRAQIAVWKTNIRLLEVKKSVLEQKKIELERNLRAEFKKVNDEQSDLGVGYANYQFLHNA